MTMVRKGAQSKGKGEGPSKKVSGAEPDTSGIMKTTSAVAQLTEIWKGYTYTTEPLNYTAQRNYEAICELIKGVEYTAADVQEFSKSLAEFSKEKHFCDKAGIFLSALVNMGSDTDYVIDVRDFPITKEPCILGYKNDKNLTVYGQVGSNFGALMKGGTARLMGSVIGQVGTNMTGGTLTVEGNARSSVGPGMGKDATIEVNGEIGGVYQPIRGKIYHKGELVATPIPTHLNYSRRF